MRLTDIFEQGTIGSTPMPTAGGSTVPTTAAPPAGAASLSGNTAALSDPKVAAADLLKQKQTNNARKKQIQDQKLALQAQLRQLDTELSNLNKSA